MRRLTSFTDIIHSVMYSPPKNPTLKATPKFGKESKWVEEENGKAWCLFHRYSTCSVHQASTLRTIETRQTSSTRQYCHQLSYLSLTFSHPHTSAVCLQLIKEQAGRADGWSWWLSHLYFLFEHRVPHMACFLVFPLVIQHQFIF